MWSKARPHPGPLPRGEGARIHRSCLHSSLRVRCACALSRLTWQTRSLLLHFSERPRATSASGLIMAHKSRRVSVNPKGIPAQSPGLRACELPWVITPRACQPQRGCGLGGDRAATPLGLCAIVSSFPRVARASQPWAGGRNPFGIDRQSPANWCAMISLGKRFFRERRGIFHGAS